MTQSDQEELTQPISLSRRQRAILELAEQRDQRELAEPVILSARQRAFLDLVDRRTMNGPGSRRR